MVPTLLPAYTLKELPTLVVEESLALYRFLTGDPDGRAGEGIYWRTVYSPNFQEYCVQAVLYYRRQLFPYHKNDFHPFYQYFDAGGALTRMLYDSGHHRARELPPGKATTLTATFPWRGYASYRPPFSPPLKSSWFELTDEVLIAWWYQPGKPQFKIRSKMADPWHPGLRNGDDSDGSFRDEAICPCCGEVELLDTMEIQGNDLERAVTCKNGHRLKTSYNGLRMSMQTVPLPGEDCT